MKIVIINGPNLNLVGKREPEIYGSQNLSDYLEGLKEKYPKVNLEIQQSNIEGELVGLIQQHGFDSDGIVINAGAYAHTSIAIGDAVASIEAPVIEVHISNVHAREEFRWHSHLTGKAIGSISGLGLNGYALAISHLILLSAKSDL